VLISNRRLELLGILAAGRELGPEIDEVALLDIGLKPMRGRHVEDAADLALDPVHLHGMAGAQFVAFRLELGTPRRQVGQHPPLGQAPGATHQQDREGEPDEPAHKEAEREQHGRVNHSRLRQPPPRAL
jgi:hypothetical protein